MDAKISKREFCRRVAKRSGMKIYQVENVYASMLEEIGDIAGSGDVLALSGFGVFYVQKHKGHMVQFGQSEHKIQDYAVFKFSASNAFNRQLRKRSAVVVPTDVSSGICAVAGEG